MTWIDWAILAFIALGALRGMRNGLIRQVVGLASAIIGGVIAANLYPRLAENIDFIIEGIAMRQLAAFAAIFIGCLVLGQIAAQILRTAASLLLLGPLDRLGGLALGFLQSTLIVAFLLYALTAFPAIPGLGEPLADSVVAPYFLERLPLLQQMLPESFRATLEEVRKGDIPDLPIPGLPR